MYFCHRKTLRHEVYRCSQNHTHIVLNFAIFFFHCHAKEIPRYKTRVEELLVETLEKGQITQTLTKYWQLRKFIQETTFSDHRILN